MLGQARADAARSFGVSLKTVTKWVRRFQSEGAPGLRDRSSRPHRLDRPTSEAIVERIRTLRLERWTGRQIACATGVSPATVSRVLERQGLNRLQALVPPEPVRRYERDHPGELIHIDIKKLGRFDQPGHRVTGSCDRCQAFAHACKRRELRHIRTRPDTPSTNGKAERFIQTALREWAYACSYPSSADRTAALPAWLHRHNWHRPHGGIKSMTPISRLRLAQDNLMRVHS